MRISWFFGFGWLSILTVVVCGIGINLLDGPVVWVLYVPFLIVALYMTSRFRLYTSQPWHRIHSKTMLAYGPLAEQEYDNAKRENREFAIETPCRGLAEHLFGETATDVFSLLQDENRKTYYKSLVESYPHVFLGGVDEDRRERVLDGVNRDIDASKLGPDILIARKIELQRSRREAADYLRALMLGKVN